MIVMQDAKILSDGPRELLPHHLADLRRSGLSDETIRLCGFYSETNHFNLANVLGWAKPPKRNGAGLMIPYRGVDGVLDGYRRVKLDVPRTDKKSGKPIKYETPKGTPNRAYIPSGTVDVLKDRSVKLLITEGEKKAAKADQEGVPCIGLVGCFGFSVNGSAKLPAELEFINWDGREVVIVFDSDLEDKPQLRMAESRLAAMLAKRGAKVQVLRLPAAADGSKVGLDDFLVANGSAELHRLLCTATRDPDEPDGGEVKITASELDPMPVAREFIASRATYNGDLTLRYYRGEFYAWRRTHYRALPDDEVRSGLIQHIDQIASRISRGIISNIVECLKAETITSGHAEMPRWLCPDPPFPANELLPTQSGLVHLPSLIAGKEYLHPSTPRFFSAQCLTYAFDPKAPKPEHWLTFLRTLWADDLQSISTLQEWFGYCLLHDTRLQKMLLLIGPKRSGKGTIARVLRALIGEDNVAGPTLAGLGTNFGLWPLLGKQLAIISDARLSGRTDSAIVTERLLSISGEDALTVDRKCLQPVTVKLPTRLMILTNELPRLGDSSGALAGRMIALVLQQSFYGREDHDLTDKLLAELPGILLWSIAGWQRLMARKRFVQPEAGRELTGEMEDLASPIGKFVRDRCMVGPEHEVATVDLYETYRRWCTSEGKDHPVDAATFGRDLRAAVPGLRREQVRDGSFRVRKYQGIGLPG
jgi:putative DNA primase/helicase